MDNRDDKEKQVMMAARAQGIAGVLFRNAIARKLGLNVADGECLSYLSIAGVAAPSELARYTGLTTGSTTAMLDRLEKAGFIQRKPNPNDRRGVLIEATAKWKQTTGSLMAGLGKAHKELLARYTDSDLDVIVDFLQRFASNVQESTRDIEEK